MLGLTVPRAALQPPPSLAAQCAAGQAGQSVAASDLPSKTPGYTNIPAMASSRPPLLSPQSPRGFCDYWFDQEMAVLGILR